MGDLTSNPATWDIGVRVDGVNVDVAMFGLDAQGKLASDEWMVFYNQKFSPGGGIELRTLQGDTTGFTVRTFMLPPNIDRLVVAVTVDGVGTMGNAAAGHLRIMDGNTETSRFSFTGCDFETERAVMLGEFYRKDGGWRFAATAQGFNGGLAALVKHFGGDVADTPTPAPTPAPTPKPSINLSKVTLKKNESISLEKKGDSFGEIRINLNWNQKGDMAGTDLDLGCLFMLQGGRPGAIQALSGNFGDYFYAPWAELMGDDRTGKSSEGENMRINGQHWASIQKILVYASIYDGAPNWAATDAVVTIKAPGQPDIIVEMDEYSSHHNVCAVATIENVGGGIRITKHVTYHGNEEMVDHAYGYGLRWQEGSKD